MGFFFGYLVGSWMKESAMKRKQEEEEQAKKERAWLDQLSKEIQEDIELEKKNGTYVPLTLKEKSSVWLWILLAFLIRVGAVLFVLFIMGYLLYMLF